MKHKTVLLVGGSSDIGIATARVFAKSGYNIQLAARSSDNLKNLISDMKIRFNINAKFYNLDILKTAKFDHFINNLDVLPDITICCVGLLGNQKLDEKNPINIENVLRTNFEGPSIFLEKLALKLQERKKATIIGISSIAGLRGRGSNYIYGSAKAGFICYLSGLRSRLNGKIHVITVLPGFVNTKMTKDLSLPKLLTSSPESIARKIYNGHNRKSFFIYPNIIWRIISLVISIIPEFVFKRLTF